MWSCCLEGSVIPSGKDRRFDPFQDQRDRTIEKLKWGKKIFKNINATSEESYRADPDSVLVGSFDHFLLADDGEEHVRTVTDSSAREITIYCSRIKS